MPRNLDRITVWNGTQDWDLGQGTLTFGDDYARIRLPGPPDFRLPDDHSVHGCPIVASRDGGLEYSGDIRAVRELTGGMKQRVLLRCLPARSP